MYIHQLTSTTLYSWDKPRSPLYGLATWSSYHLYTTIRVKEQNLKKPGWARKKFGSLIVVEYVHFLFYFLLNLPFLGETSWIQLAYINAVFLSWYVLCPVLSSWWYCVRWYWFVALLIIVLVSQQPVLDTGFWYHCLYCIISYYKEVTSIVWVQ